MVSHVTSLSCTAEDSAEDVVATKKYYRYQRGKMNTFNMQTVRFAHLHQELLNNETAEGSLQWRTTGSACGTCLSPSWPVGQWDSHGEILSHAAFTLVCVYSHHTRRIIRVLEY